MQYKNFLTQRVQAQTAYDQSLANIAAITEGMEGIAFLLPDLTPSSALPIGTTLIVSQNQPVTSNLIGMDVGCGYRFVKLETSSNKYVTKTGGLRKDKIQKLVQIVSEAIKTRTPGDPYLGTLGGGNHFVDILVVERENKSAGVISGHIYLLIHTGSRMNGKKLNEYLSETQHIGQHITGVKNVTKYAAQNREMLETRIADALNTQSEAIWDQSHNTMRTDGKTVIVMKGTTYVEPGEIAVLPTTAAGEVKIIRALDGVQYTGFTVNHGLGRKNGMTRSRTAKKVKYRDERNTKSKPRSAHNPLQHVELNVAPDQMRSEMPKAYKDPKAVLEAMHRHNLAKVIATLKPIGVVVER